MRSKTTKKDKVIKWIGIILITAFSTYLFPDDYVQSSMFSVGLIIIFALLAATDEIDRQGE